MLAKIFILAALAYVALADRNADKESWEMSLEVAGFGSKAYFNATGASDPDAGAPPPNVCLNMSPQVCQNFTQSCENAINQQILKEFEASYTYLAMAAYLSRDDPHQMGFAKFFYKASAEERDHALKLVEYQNERGGKVDLMAIKAPTKQKWTSALDTMTDALELEREVNEALLKLHKLAEGDPHLQDFLETHYLSEQVESIRELAGYVTQLKRVRTTNPGLGEHIIDQEFKDKQ